MPTPLPTPTPTPKRKSGVERNGTEGNGISLVSAFAESKRENCPFLARFFAAAAGEGGEGGDVRRGEERDWGKRRMEWRRAESREERSREKE